MVNIFYLFCLTLSFVTLVLHVIYFGNDKSRTFYEYLYMGYQEMGKCRKFFGEVKWNKSFTLYCMYDKVFMKL